MNCELCHEEETSTFLAPNQTMLFMEAVMATNDYSGQVGPTFGRRTLTTRHNKRGNYAMSDGHVERMNHAQSVAAEKKKRFWFPTDNTSGPGGMNMAAGLHSMPVRRGLPAFGSHQWFCWRSFGYFFK